MTDAFGDRFGRIAKAAGLPTIRLHDLRHTYASLLVEAGTDPRTGADILGHATASFFIDRYVHTSEQRKRSAIGAVGNLVAARSAQAL